MYSTLNGVRRRSVLAAFALISLGASAVYGADYYAASNGSSTGSGSISSPWDLASALSGSKPVKAGDTLWLRGGTYHGTFTSKLVGTSTTPIIVRQMTGEHASIDGGNSGGSSIFTVMGSYTWFWGFEIMSSDPNRVSAQVTSWPTDIGRGECVTIDQSTPHPGLKFINMIIHDGRQGISLWDEAQTAEVYGNLVYSNGWDAPDRGHGHGIYSQNQTGTMNIRDNIVSRNFSHGMQIYGSSTAYLNNYSVDGDIWFNNGEPSIFGFDRNVLLGGDSVANNISFTNNSFYTCKLKIGYAAPANNVTVSNNYLPVAVELNATNVTMIGNTYESADIDFTPASYPNNTYLTSSPTGLRVVVRPNAYEAGRANIVVYSWSGATSAAADLSGVLKPGDTFEVHDAQNFYGSPVVSGTYNGTPITLPLSLTAIAKPIGNVQVNVAHTSSQFSAFVVFRTGQSVNKPPVVNAGPDVSATMPTASVLNGSATDDGIPGPLTIAWSMVSGPGTVTFAKPNAASTTATFSAAGSYDLRLTGYDGSLTTTDDVTVVVTAANPVLISNVAASSITPAGATITWTTNSASSSQVDYGLSTSYGSTTALNSSGVTNHVVYLTGLQPNTTYNLRVRSTDVSGTIGVSGNYTFKTAVGSSGNVVYLSAEAEGAALTSPAMVVADSRANGGLYVISTTANSGTIKFTFNVPIAGTYIIWGRVLAPNGNQDSFFVSADNGLEDVYDDAEGTWSSAFQWTRVNGRNGGAPLTLNPRTFTFAAGSHTITFRVREASSVLDSIIVTNDGTFIPQ